MEGLAVRVRSTYLYDVLYTIFDHHSFIEAPLPVQTMSHMLSRPQAESELTWLMGPSCLHTENSRSWSFCVTREQICHPMFTGTHGTRRKPSLSAEPITQPVDRRTPLCEKGC